MSGWILDTNIISQFAPTSEGSPRAGVQLRDWVQRHQDGLFLSVVSVIEVTAGIEKLRRTGSSRRATALDEWLERIVDLYGERILPVETGVGLIAGKLADRARACGSNPGLSDILIAATASAHGHGLLTHNIKHFAPLQLAITVLDPLAQSLPET